MAVTNYERVGKALDLLKIGLVHFVEREMESGYGDAWQEKAQEGIRNARDWEVRKGQVQWDVHLLLSVMWGHWNVVFNKTLGHAERSLVSELRDIRNRWAHQQTFSSDDAYRALDSIVRLLTAVAAEEAQQVEEMKQELLRVRFEEQARQQRRKQAVLPVEGHPSAGLQSWRDIMTPHPDVASGRYQQAEFAADLAQVHQNSGSSEYRDPAEFFRRTYLTGGLRQLLKGAILRLSATGGDPIVELQTNFGGGKTHSLLALYHLFSGTAVTELAGVDSILSEISIESLPTVRRVVLVGHALSPAKTYRKPDGCTVHTLWGELAWQIGGKEAYQMVAEADQQGVRRRSPSPATARRSRRRSVRRSRSTRTARST